MNWHIPPWMARPATVLSTLAALAGAAFILLAAATGNYWWAIWGGACFLGAAAFWYVGDLAGTSGPPGPA